MTNAVKLMLVGVIASGFLAGQAVSPVVYVTTALVAIILIAAARSGERASGGAGSAGEFPELPRPLRTDLAAAFEALPEGDARQLLLAVVVQARPIFAAPSTAFDPAREQETRGDVESLVAACAATARELSAFDVANSAAAPDEPAAAARTRMVTRLRDAAAALHALYTAGVANGTPASDRVADLVGEIKAEAVARDYAIRGLQSSRP